MSETVGSITLDSDIISIITSINNEIARRGTTGTVSSPSQYTTELALLPTAMKTALANINAAHTYSVGVQTHLGGTTKTLNSTGYTFTAGTTFLTSAMVTGLSSDISVLAAQIQCTNTQATCACNAVCSANGVLCGNCCNGQCCNGQSYTCYQGSCCNYNGGCGNCCNGVCSNSCNPNTSCSCNTQCTCEYV
jgi:hypothetical protein